MPGELGLTTGGTQSPVPAGGDTMAGTCLSTPGVLPDGRIRLTERWQRVDGSVGVSYVVEVRA